MPQPIYPSKLQRGDTLRVISPATSLAKIPVDQRELSEAVFERLGLRTTYATHVEECDQFLSSSLESRLADLHDAFLDPGVQAIFTTLGGFNSNQLLDHIDYELISRNPKVFCGYSDITALATAIYVRAGLVTYSGPHFTTFGMKKGIDYTIESLRQCLFSTEPVTISTADHWSDDAWFNDQVNRSLIPNNGYLVINEGEAEGTLLGGNASTFVLLGGTRYAPPLGDSILFLEDDYESGPLHFDRHLQSIIQQPTFSGVRGLVIGRFQPSSSVSDEALARLIKSKGELDAIPVVANASFGHTTPQFTFPIGGRGELCAKGSAVELRITKHVAA